MNLNILSKKVIAFKKSRRYNDVKNRLKEFDFSDKSQRRWFSELCFCLLTANSSAELGIKVQNALGNKFHLLTNSELKKELRNLKYRFPNKRGEYISCAQKFFNIKNLIQDMPSKEARKFLVKNVKGIGMKEASHFLRNTGKKDVCIIDRHILRSLGYNLSSLNKKRYLEIENELLKLARITKTNLAELDLILWAIQTGKVLK